MQHTLDSSVFVYTVSREQAGKQTNDGIGQGLRLAIGLRGAVIFLQWFATFLQCQLAK